MDLSSLAGPTHSTKERGFRSLRGPEVGVSMATRGGGLLLFLLLAGASMAWAGSPGQEAARPADDDRREARLERELRGARERREEREADAEARAAWREFWSGGKADPAYLQHKAKVAVEQAEAWRHLLPQAGILPIAPGNLNTWVNLGPKANISTTTRPDIDSGRVTAIVPHPSDPLTLYVATSGGGVFRCGNADLNAATDWTWTPVTDNLPSSSAAGHIAVGAMAVSTYEPYTLYLGMGDAFDDQAAGFYRSADGGASWAPASGLGNQTRTYDILPLSTSIILVGTDDGLKRSTDGGVTFSPVPIGGRTLGQVWSIRRCTSTQLVLSLQRAGLGSLWYSQDAGATWSPATLDASASALSLGRISLSNCMWGGSYVFGIGESNKRVARGLLNSTDMGQTWSFIPAPVVPGGLFLSSVHDGEQGDYNQLIAVDPYNWNRIFVGANQALYRTDDAGMNWTQITSWTGDGHVYAHADFHAAAWTPYLLSGGLFPSYAPTLYFGTDGGLSILRQPGLPAASIPTGLGPVPSNPAFLDNRRNRGLVSHLVYGVGSTTATSPADSPDRITLGLQDNGTRVRFAGSTSMAQSGTFEACVGGDGFGTLIHPNDGNQMLATGIYGRIYRSADGGLSSFADAVSGLTGVDSPTTFPLVTHLVQGAPGDTVYTHSNAKVFRSTSFGQLWSPVSMSGVTAGLTLRALGASASNPDALAILTTGSTGFVTTNGGAAWHRFGAFPNFGSYDGGSCVWFDTQDASILYAGSVSPTATSSHIWRSADSGATWTALDRTSAGGSNGFPFGIPVHVIKNDPSNNLVVFAATDIGLYRSTDAGATWSRYGQGLPMVAVRDFWVSPASGLISGLVRAGTYGRGVWELREANPLPIPPYFTSQPQSKSVPLGQVATFVAVASGNPTPAYQWQKFVSFVTPFGPKSYWVDIAGATQSMYSTAPVTAADNGARFRVTANNQTGILATSNAATLTVR